MGAVPALTKFQSRKAAENAARPVKAPRMSAIADDELTERDDLREQRVVLAPSRPARADRFELPYRIVIDDIPAEIVMVRRSRASA